MVELFGWIEDTTSTGDEIETVWRIPAQSERMARRQAKANQRIKDASGSEVTSVTRVRSGDLPGQSIYQVETVSER